MSASASPETPKLRDFTPGKALTQLGRCLHGRGEGELQSEPLLRWAACF